MHMAFMGGVLAAWVVAHVALGTFFMLAHALGRREPEYRLFGALCFALALATLGIAWALTSEPGPRWELALRLTHAGGILACALNLHFVMRYAEIRNWSRIALGAYGLGLIYLLFDLFGPWWQEGTIRIQPARVLGLELSHVSASPTPFAGSFYVVAAAELLTSFAFLLQAFRSGKREALWSLLGAVVVGAAVGNDVLLLTGVTVDSLYLVPHTFLAYAFAVATTLLMRYRLAAGQLEEAATSLRQRTEELRHSHLEIRMIQDELVRKKQLAAVGELSAAIAHEVRNPLAIIVNAVAGLRRSQVSDKDRTTLLDIVDEETARLNRLVTDLLRFARPVEVKRALVNLAELAERARMVAQSECEIRVESSIDPALQTVSADPGLMRLVFDNLVLNACQSMPQGGVIQVRLLPAEVDGSAAVRVEITDSGHGMDEQVLNRATDPFFTTRPSGTGLGLPIVERIVEAHGGKIEINSERGRGTTVGLLLPLAPGLGAHSSEARERWAWSSRA